MNFVKAHKFTGNWAFLFQAAHRAADNPVFEDLSSDRGLANDVRSSHSFERRKKYWIQEHMRKVIRSQLFHHIEWKGLYRN